MSGDIEFYYSATVLSVAYATSGKTGADFSALSYRTRKRHLDQAVRVVRGILSSTGSMKEMKRSVETNPP